MRVEKIKTQITAILFCLAIVLSFPLFGNTLTERAQKAEELLGNFQLEEAVVAYTLILEEVDLNDPSSLAFAYWIFRERSYAAYLLNDSNMVLSDIHHMKTILTALDRPESDMDEYYYALDLAKLAKGLLGDAQTTTIIPCGVGSWCEERWNDFVVASEKALFFLDESYSRVTQNNERLEYLLSQKRAQELYYANLVHNQIEMERIAQRIYEKDLALTQDLKSFLYENQYRLSAAAAGLAGTILLWETGNPRGTIGSGLVLVSQSYELGKFIQEEGGLLWAQYQEIQNDRRILTEMETENREASYATCILEKKVPNVYHAPENDTPWYNGYYAFDVNERRFDFQFGISKNF